MTLKADWIGDQPREIDLDNINIVPVFDRFSEGVIIVDARGVVKYYNKAMAAIDDITSEEAVNRPVTKIYDLNRRTSKIMQCLKRRAPITNQTFIYRTRKGKVANTIHNVYPFFRQGRLEGAICFVKEYNVLEETISDVSIPKDDLNASNGTRFTFADVISGNPVYLKALQTARRTAKTPSPIMLFGETGTGKELFAQSIHNHAFKGDKKYIPINCSAIPENLLEGILFGTSRGAFTGAKSKPGLFEKAHNGTLFLDEVDSMGTALQAKILRVIQEKKVRRLGALGEKEINVKIISSINRPPGQSIRDKRLREDLFFRLGVVLISIPPLKEHMDDLPALTRHFIKKHSLAMTRTVAGISDAVMERFMSYHWPGNIRELEHVVESAINIVEDGDVIETRHLRSCFLAMSPPGATVPLSGQTRPERRSEPETHHGIKFLKALNHSREKEFIRQALEENRGNISMTARQMGISRQLLYYKIKKYNLR